MDEFSPYQALEHALQKWWLILVFILLGGLAGWSVHKLHAPLYEAKASFSVVVDLRKSGPIDTLEQDKSIYVVYDIFLSDLVVNQVLAQAETAGILLDRQAFLKMAYVERKSETWEIRIRNSDPAVAQTLVNLWADLGYSTLKTYSLHAQQADALTLQLNLITLCIQQIHVPGDSTALCKITDPTELAAEFQRVSDALYTERVARGGLASWILFNLEQKADLPAQPISYGTNGLVLLGGFIGFLISLGWITGSIQIRSSKKKP
jgi:uncharacterized protein involved in exopolysaccharide biosynthesis